MGNIMNEEKMKTLDELIRSFDTGYYRDKIEIAEKQIYNLEIGFSQGSKAKMPVLSQKEVKKEVDILKKYRWGNNWKCTSKRIGNRIG